MASKSKSKDKTSPTADILQKCKKDLCVEKVAAGSERAASETKVNSGKGDEQYKICCVVKADETNTFYRNFKFCIGTSTSKDAEQIQGKVKELIDKDKALKKKFKDLVKLIKETKTKMEGVLEVACRLDRCKEEEQRCNLDLYKALEDGIPNLWDRLEHIKDHAETCYGKITLAFDAAIDIAGILTFSDVDSLEDLGKKLNELLVELNKDCEENLKSSAAEEAKANDELNKVLQELSISRFEHCVATAKESGLCDVFDFICDPECDEKDPGRIREICEKFTDDLPPDDKNDPCDELDDRPPGKDSSSEEWSMKQS